MPILPFRICVTFSLLACSVHATTFSGCVLDGLTGKPIANAIVTVGSSVARTDGNGNFKIQGHGTAIAARAYGYSRSEATMDARTPNAVQLKLTPVTPHALYLSFWAVGTPGLREAVLRLATTTSVNAVVIDVKGDSGYLCFRTSVPLAAEIGAQRITTVPDMVALINRLHKGGIYTIARIVTFKDNILGPARPNWAVHQNGKLFRDREGLAWCDPFSPDVRAYNVNLAVEAAKAGFDEIQFDYVRFPDAKGVEFSQSSTAESRPKAITAFLEEAREKLIPYNVFLSADVFGYICWNAGDTGIGQKIEALAGPLDYISPMLYPSGFMYGIPNYRDPVTHPYEIVRFSLDRARERTKLEPVRFRPWLQAFADYAFDKRQFGEEQIQAQIRAAQSFGADGWLLWNPRNLYSADAIRSTAKKQLDSRESLSYASSSARALQTRDRHARAGFP
jgi:hypothetical protein